MLLRVSRQTSAEAAGFDLTPDEARLLLQLAFAAIGRKRFVSAGRLLDVLEHFRPGDGALLSARAVALLSRRAFRACCEFLEHQATLAPLPPMAAVFYGIALHQCGEVFAARRQWLPVAAQTEDSAAARFAMTLL